MCDPQIRITNPGTRSCRSISNFIWAEALNYVVIKNFLFRIDTHKDKDQDNENSFLLVFPEKYEPIIFPTYHGSLLAEHQGPYRMTRTIRQRFFTTI